MNTYPAYLRDWGAAKTRRLSAALLAVAMLVGTAITGAVTAPYAAYADNNNNLADGSLCTPTEQSMGEEKNPATERDSGVATWVGGDMYVGKKSDNLTNENGPDGSYAVEAEGLTVVDGKLMLNPKKTAWHDGTSLDMNSSRGFRFGIAGFGTQYRPSNGSTVLAVGGNSNTVMDGAGSTADVKAWTNSGFIAKNSHKAWLNGSRSSVWGWDARESVRAVELDRDNSARVQWRTEKNGVASTANAGDLTKVPVATTDNGKTAPTDLSEGTFFDSEVMEGMSTPLYTEAARTGTVSQGIAEDATFTRQKYNKVVSYDFTLDGMPREGTDRGISSSQTYINSEKVITFTGTNNKTLEVFDLDPTWLSNDYNGQTYRGVVFKFVDIDDTASVVINVKGENQEARRNISFHTGWRFWWNGTEIGDGYVSGSDHAAMYAKAAQKILWNFHDTDNLTIYGGVANEGVRDNSKFTEDDPAAAMLGSIIVGGALTKDGTSGNFESHVTTNGRVYVAGDFSMYNPYKAARFTQPDAWDGDSSSVIDMDQERHNFPWNGSFTSSCAAISWKKSDEKGNLLKASTWGVYPTYADAKDGTNALMTVSDDSFFDKDHGTDGSNGSFKITGLAKNARYYIKEIGAPEGYATNANIYYAATGDSTDTVAVVNSVDENGNLGEADIFKGTDGTVAIINHPSGHEVAWKKVSEDDAAGTPLAGSAWQISQVSDDTINTKIWNVIDNTNAAEKVSVSPTEITLNADDNYRSTLTASVEPTAALQHVDWYFSDADGGNRIKQNDRVVLSNVTKTTADIVSASTEDATEYVVACSTSTPNVCSNVVKVNVKAANVTLDVKDEKNINPSGKTITTAKGESLTYTATTKPAVPVVWMSSNEDVATVSSQSDGESATVTVHSLGSAVITAKAGNKTVSFTVTAAGVTVYFKKTLVNWRNYYLYYDDGTSWKFVRMDRTCGDYVSVSIPQVASGKGFVFHDQNTTNGNNWYKPSMSANAQFTFNGNAVMVVNAYNDWQGSVAPVGCAATRTVADTGDTANADGSYTDGSVTDANAVVELANESPEAGVQTVADEKVVSCVEKDGDGTNPGVKCDIDTVAGQFKVDGLDVGTYLIREITAPDGYTLNKTVYQFTIDDDGTVTWKGGYADGNTSGTLDDTLVPGADNAIADKPTEVTWNKVDAKGGKLAGSQWKIVEPTNTGGSDGSNTTEQKTYCVADNVTVSSNGTNPNTTFENCDGTKLSDSEPESGTITVKGLPVGTYTLTETKAPDGYKLPENVTYTLNIVAKGTSSIVKSDGPELGGANVPNSSVPVDLQIPVKKSLKYTDWPKNNGTYVKFKFAITAFDGNVGADSLPKPSGCKSLANGQCAIELAPADGATDLQNVTAYFGKFTFTDGQLASDAGTDGDYAKTYVYRIAEIVPDTADQVEDLRYSKAEWKVEITVSRNKTVHGAYQGLKVSYTVTQTKDDAGNDLTGTVGKSSESGSFTSVQTSARGSDGRATANDDAELGTDSRAGDAQLGAGGIAGSDSGSANVVNPEKTADNVTSEVTFVNTKVLTGLPSTGSDWTGRMVIVAGAAFILAGTIVAGGYHFATRRREEASA